MNRSANIDLCRGMLFILMANTHAMSVTHIPSKHWLFSDLWLPNGWATAIFVVLSGYGVGFICGARAPTEARWQALCTRSRQILAVMVSSNIFFAMMRELVAGNNAPLHSLSWWTGMVTLDTPWTISGVLLPTALVVVCGPALFKWMRKSPWLLLGALLLARLATAAISLNVANTPAATNWLVRILFVEGLGGFPVLPFLLNGCIGVWLGLMRNVDEYAWRGIIFICMFLQLLVYATSFFDTNAGILLFVGTFSAVGKFAWMFMLAHAAKLLVPHVVTAPIELIGKFALGSFVMHRLFMHGLNQVLPQVSATGVQMEERYFLMWSLTLLLCWGLCIFRKQSVWIDAPFRRMAL
jgi:hypothetical protein